MHIVQGFAGAVIDICIEQQLHTRSLCSRIEFFKFPIVIDSGTVNFSYMLYYVTFANQIICTFSLVLKSPLVKFARKLLIQALEKTHNAREVAENFSVNRGTVQLSFQGSFASSQK